MLTADQERIGYVVRAFMVLLVILALTFTQSWYTLLGAGLAIIGYRSFMKYLQLRALKSFSSLVNPKTSASKGDVIDADFSTK